MTAKETLHFFLVRTAMFVDPVDRNNIVSFITGFELGAEKSYLIDGIKKYLEETHYLLGGALGWPNQVKLFAELNSITWIEAFKKVAETVLKKDTDA